MKKLIKKMEESRVMAGYSFEKDFIKIIESQIAELFGVDRTVVTKHLQNIYTEEELDKDSVSAIFAQVQKEGERDVKGKH